jgi:hypothetical protein
MEESEDPIVLGVLRCSSSGIMPAKQAGAPVPFNFLLSFLKKARPSLRI